MITYGECSNCPESWAGPTGDLLGAWVREHEADTWHTVKIYRARYVAGRVSCDTCIAWPCRHTRPEPELDEATLGAPTRLGKPLASGLRLCERHRHDRADWTSLDPGSDVAKRLVRPGINLVQIGSPAVQLKYGESYLDAFRRIIAGQVEIVDSICAKRSACADVIPLEDIDPRQCCLSDRCGLSYREHKITRCLEIQWVRCTCPECAPLYQE